MLKCLRNKRVSQKQIEPASPPPKPRQWLDPHAVTVDTDHPRSRRRRFIWGTAVVSFLLIIGLGGLYSRTHSIVAVKIASLPATHATHNQLLATTVRAAINDYRLSIKAVDGQAHTYTLAEAGFTPDVAATLNAAKGQHGIFFWHTKTIPLQLNTNKAALTAFIAEHAIQATKPAQEATLVVQNGKAVSTPEADGSGYAVANAPQTLQAAAAYLDKAPLVMTQGVIHPSITTRSLQAKQKELQRIIDQDMTFIIDGSTRKAGPSDIVNWLDLNPVPAAGTVDITANSGKIAAYIDGLTKEFRTPSSETLTDVSDDGSLQIVIQDGAARTVEDQDKIVTNIASALLRTDGQTLKVGLSNTASSRTLKGHSYPKWLLVNISSKRMYAYEDTTLVRSFLITAGAPATPTVTGTYKIYAKYRSQDMQGENADGSRYFQPNVEYVNYFYRDYAVHGNYWRPASYFGAINSSHGCIGITNTDAAWIYSWAPIGTTVMVHS